MKKNNIFSLLVVACTACLALMSCEQTLELTKMNLKVTVDESAVVEKEDSRQAIIKDDMGNKIVIDRLDRTHTSDVEIGNLILSTSEKLGFALKGMKTKPILKSKVTGSYIYGTSGDSLLVVAGFIGDGTTDGYLMTVKGDKDFDYTITSVAEEVDYLK